MESQRMNLSVVEESNTLQHEQNENEKNVDDDDKIRPWVDLPSELLNLIFSSLFDPSHILFSSIRDQIRFRLTCKGWQSSVGCLLGQFPLLMSLKPRKGAPFTFFNPITNKEIQVFDDDEGNGLEYPELAYSMNHIRCSRFGWWLMSSGCLLFFYNPFIPGSTFKLPLARIPLIGCIDSMSFTAPPTSKDCIVFLHDLYDPDNKKEVVIHRWCYGEDHWTDYHIDCQSSFGQSSGNPIFYRSAFYQLNERGRLGISDPRKGREQHIWKDLPRTKLLRLKNIYSPPYTKRRRKPSPYTKKRKRKQQPKIRTNHYMAECDGKFVMVVVEYKEYFSVHSVHIFELDWSRMEWVTVQSLGNKAMFICETGSLLIKTNGGAENKIYFPVFVNTKDGDPMFVNTFVNTKDGDGHATKKVGGFYCLENRTYNFPPIYWNRVTRSTWIDNKFKL